MNNRFSLRQFKYKYGTHEKCLEAIKRLKYPDEMNCPSCKRLSFFYPVTNRTSFACKFCGYQIYPLAGTIFEKTTTPLDLWFFAMYLMIQTRAGISAKQLERMLGVTYKTAWRMFKQIRLLMAQEPTLLDGIVEIDESYFGGKGKNRATVANFSEIPKEAVWGAVKRGGKTYLKHIPNTGKYTLIQQVQENVSPKAHVMSDELLSYKNLFMYGYDKHDAVTHSKGEYARGIVHNNNIENVWSHLKRGITGVYRVVSKKYLQAYVDEYAFRYNNRLLGGKMFDILLRQVAEVKIISLP